LADEAARRIAAPAINLCGRFSIPQLCRLLRRLDLLITPDTGPMHIAAWLGTPILNLSMGPVNAWETAPFAPGHHVLRPHMSCAGCWACPHQEPPCKRQMSAEKTTLVAQMLLEKQTHRLAALELQGLRLFTTWRDPFGLFELKPLDHVTPPRLQRSLYWKYFFGLHLGYLPKDAQNRLRSQADALRASPLAPVALKAGQKLLQRLNTALRGQGRGGMSAISKDDAWMDSPPISRPLSSYLQLLLRNADFSPAALRQALELTESHLGDLSA
jgi:hypothetical protein